MLGVIGNRFSIGKETYPPFSAELHYFRIEKRYWSICFERIKRAGFKIIATAVPWSMHQGENKFFDFSGLTDPKKDLIVFLELAREFGFKVILRPGPWVAGQLECGGLPKTLYTDLKVFARDASGQERPLPKDHGVDGGYLPSYLHQNFQFHLRNYFKAFIEATKNYVHPRGPVFMVELDYETSFGRLLEPDSADYNPDVLARYYPPFLEGLYGDIKSLDSHYKEKHQSFAEVEPPRKFRELNLKDYPKVLDWFKFRQFMLNTYLETLEDIFTSYTVEPLLFRSLYFRPGDLLPAFNLVPEDRAPFLGANVFPEGSYFDLSVKARFLRSEYDFAFASSFTSGAAVAVARREEHLAPIRNNTRRFYLASGLAAGFKGMNHYMFVDRNHWHGGPLHADGTISEGYELIKRFNTAVMAVGLEEMKSPAEVAVVGNRLYNWLALTSSNEHFTYLPRLVRESTSGFCRDVMRLKINFGVRENRDFESLKQYKVLFAPVAEIMARRDQEAIVELLKAGVTVILCGLMPRWDETMKECQVLANSVRMRSAVDTRIGTVAYKGGDFATYVYGSIRSTDDTKVKKLVKLGPKLVGVSSSRFKGTLYYFAFDVASGGNHKKLGFIESILASEKVIPHLYCSDPSVDLAFHVGEKTGLFFVIAPPAGELADSFEARKKEVIVRADFKKAGFKAASLKLTNLFEGEEAPPLKTTAKELEEGITLTVDCPDGAIFLVEKR
ncbi:MAG TPA: beta-galactosidase [Candidatus Deferrimicrobium sp.]|nr:beta-galactosidase [Candidatus Deferrimicrobium sp.]